MNTNLTPLTNYSIIGFDKYLLHTDVPKFRGGINNAIENPDVLCHNHYDESLRYAYPLVQYKVLGGKAAIVAIGEGLNIVRHFLNVPSIDIRIGEEQTQLDLAYINIKPFSLQLMDKMKTYRIQNWMPLNQDNHANYQMLEGLSEQCEFLENILVGNILSMAKGLDVTFDDLVVCRIDYISEPHLQSYKGMKMVTFNIQFKSNVFLPQWIGLGKGVSRGFGTVVYDNLRKNNK